MFLEFSEALFQPATLLWLAATVIAVAIFFGSINRRRTHLTDTLRDYVDQDQQGREAIQHEKTEPSD